MGLIHVLSRFQALIIRSFLETEICPGFKWSLTNRELYMQHVNGKEPLLKVTMNMIYNKKFFDIIKKIILFSPVDIWKMSLKQIYNALLDINMLKGLDNSIIPLHVEVKLPWIDWKMT